MRAGKKRVLLSLVLAASLLFAGLVPGYAGTGRVRRESAFSDWDVQEYPDCTSPGYEVRYGTTGTMERREIPALGHSFEGWTTKRAASCTEPGLEARMCSRCGEVETREIPAAGHSFGGWTVTASGSCTRQGQQQRTCSVCGVTETASTGYGDHSWGSWYTEREASCYQEGIQARVCQECGAYESYSTGYGNHSWGSWYTEQNATCYQEGIEARTCVVCGAYESYSTGYAAHSFGEWETTLEPTDFSAGTRRRVCGVCGQEQEETVDPAGTLRRGDRGEAVTALQEALNEAGFDCGEADGIFGGLTETAVKSLEASLQIEEDGIAWPGVQKTVLRGGFALPKSGYQLILDKSAVPPRVRTVGDNYGYQVDMELLLDYIGEEDAEEVRISYQAFRGEGNRESLLSQGLVTYEGYEEPMKAGDSYLITFSTYPDRECAEAGAISYVFHAEAKVRAKEGEEELILYDDLSFDLPLPELPEPVGYELPPVTEGSVALLLKGSYDETIEWKENDIVPIELTLINVGKVPVTDLCLTGFLRTVGYAEEAWKEELLKDEPVVLEPGESYPLTLNYTALDVNPGNYHTFLYFEATALTLDGYCLYTGCALPDPLHPDVVGNGTAALLLNGETVLKEEYQVGDEIQVDLELINVGDCELSKAFFSWFVMNRNGMADYHYEPTREEWKYLECGKQIPFTVKHVITQEDLDSEEILLKICGCAVVNASKVLGGVTGATVTGNYVLRVPMKGKEEPGTDQAEVILPLKTGETETEGENKPVLTVWPEEELSSFYHGGEQLTFHWELENTGEAEGFFGGIFLATSLDPERKEVLSGDAFLISPGSSLKGEMTLTVPENTGETPEVQLLFDGVLISWEPEFQETVSDPFPVFLTVLPKEAQTPLLFLNWVNDYPNGEYYRNGEPIEFQVEVLNPTERSFTDVTIFNAGDGETVLYLEELPPAAESGIPCDLIHITDLMDVTTGSYYAMAGMRYTRGDGSEAYAYSNGIGVYCGGGGETEVLPALPVIRVQKSEQSVPANGSYYTEGEVIDYLVEVTNEGSTEARDLFAADYLNAKEYRNLGSVPVLQPEEKTHIAVAYTVTAEDVARGYVIDTAVVSTAGEAAKETIGAVWTSNPVVSDTDGEPDLVDIIVSEGGFYFPGWNGSLVPGQEEQGTEETIGQQETYPDETGPIETITDDETNPGETEPIETITDRETNPGETEPMTEETLPEPPTETEPATEETLPEPPTETEQLTEETLPEPPTETEPVTEETLPEPPTETEPATEETLPEPPTETEPVTEETLPEPPTETEPVTEETLPEPPTETEPVTEVTLPEPPTGTEPVTEVTLPEPPTETAPEETEGTPGINPPKEPEKKTSGTIHPAGPILKSQLGGAGRGSASCYHDLQERGDATSVYEVHYCPVHDLVRQAAEELLAAAVTEEEKLFALQQIRALWQNRLNAMYDDLLAQAAKETEEEKRKEKEEIIRKEKEAFYLQLTCYEADLELLFPENQLLVAEKVADALRYRTMDLCYEMSNAPKDRVDSYLKEEIRFLPGEIPGEDCGYTYERLENGKVRMREFFCAEEAGIRETMVRMTEQARDFPELFRESLASYGISPEEIGEEDSLLEAAWRRSGRLWKCASDQITTKRYLDADEAGKEVILASREAFADYLKCREALLTLFYEKEPETALEVLAELAMRRTVQFCESLAEAGE